MKRKLYYSLSVVGFILFLGILLNQYYIATRNVNLYSAVMDANSLTDEEIDWLQKQRYLNYGETFDALPPQIVPGEMQYQGYSLDIVHMLSVEIGLPISFTVLPWADILKGLDNGEVDFTNVSYSKERAEKYLLSEPLYKTRGMILARNSGGKIKKIYQLDNSTIGAVQGDYLVDVLRQRLPNARIKLYKNTEDCALAMHSGEVDVIGGDELNLMYYMQKKMLYAEFSIIEEPVYVVEAVMAMRKTDPLLLSILNKSIRRLKENHAFDKVQQKWLVSSVHLSTVDQQRVIALGIAAFLGSIVYIAILFLFANYEMKRLVDLRTQELSRSKKALETTLNAVPYWLVEVDAQKNIIKANQKFLLDMGMSFEEAQNVVLNPFLRQFYSAELFEMIDQALLGGEYVQRDIVYGNRIFSIACAHVLSVTGIIRVLIAMEDVTKHRMNEKQVVQTTKMAAVGQLAAGISHEIRNPLGLIRNYSYALRHGLVSPDQIRPVSEAIDVAVTSADSMVENLLNFSRISPKEVTQVPLYGVISSIVHLRKKRFEELNIQVSTSCAEDIYIKSDPEGIKHALINLVINAEDALPEGGTLEICVHKQKGCVLIDVIDSGIGISRDSIEHLFNPFYTTKPLGKGTGLGLYIVYNYMQECGGDITVRSEPGQRTVFRLSFKETDANEDKA